VPATPQHHPGDGTALAATPKIPRHLKLVGHRDRPKASLEAIASMQESPGLILVTGILTISGGAATIVGHNVWSGGALPVAVTLLGWVALIKGIAIMAAPPRVLAAFYRALHYPVRFRLYMAVAVAFSAWLTSTAFLS
jgi:hypothetical protein